MITGCGDGVVRCFDAKSGHLLRVKLLDTHIQAGYCIFDLAFQTFSGHDGAVMAIQTSGERIYTATTDGVIRAFKIDWEFVKQYLQVLSGEVVEDDLGDDFKPEEDDDDDEDIESETDVQGIIAITLFYFIFA